MNKILFLIFIICIHSKTFAQCHIDDYKALRALYISTNGGNWKNQSNWDIKSDTPPLNCNLSKFYGITLNEIGRVAIINLGQNNLTGVLPIELKNLKSLNTLWLNQNAITGFIPKELGELQLLERLALSYNKFEGSIPVEIYALKSLKELSLEVNQLEGIIPYNINRLENLQRLLLNNNSFSGTLPKELGDLKFIKELNLSNNKFEGCFPESFKNLCTKTPNFNGNTLLANWSNFCKTPSECTFEFKLKEVSFEIDTLFISKSPNRKQLIFISEGFTKDEFPKFKSFVVQMTSKLKLHFPNISFEALLAYVPSNESGISHSGTAPSEPNDKNYPIQKRDTYFETDADSKSRHNEILINEKIAIPFINRYFPENIYPISKGITIPVYIVNTDSFGSLAYGAYAGSVEGVSSRSYLGTEQNTSTIKDAEWVFAHELGHFFGHADIQDGHVTPQGEWANATREIDRSKIRWKQFIKDSTPIPTPKNSGYDNEIGLFSVVDKAGNPTGWYRPCNSNCIMQSASAHLNFCKVCGSHLDRNDNLPFANVENGKYGGYYYPGNRVSIQANTPEKSLVFSHWEGSGIAFENNLNSRTTFLMPNNNVNVKAIYKNIVLANDLPSQTESFQVYPNPFNNSIKVNFNEPLKKTVKLDLINSIGKIIKEWTTNQQENTFEVLELSTGTYILKCELNDKIEVVKLIKL